MPKVNVYLSEDLADAVREHQIPISAVCQMALQREVDRVSTQATLHNQMERLEVELWGPDESPYTATFVGTWLVPPDDDNRFSEHDAGACYGIALTKRNRFAVYCRHVNGRWAPILSDYDSLEDARRAGESEQLLALGAAAVREEFTVDLDI